MTLNRFLLCVASCALLLSMPRPSAAQSKAAKDSTDQAVLKRNEECNAAELRADIKAMDDCETEDFTHTHASGQIEEKTGYLQGVGSGAHKFLSSIFRPPRPLHGDSASRRGHITSARITSARSPTCRTSS